LSIGSGRKLAHPVHIDALDVCRGCDSPLGVGEILNEQIA
jgi:hypothetical protein